jgi:membrane-bound ClpP family serine protease
MNAIVLLFALGIVLLAFEVFIPGGVLGVIGALLMFTGSGLTFAHFGLQAGALATLLAFALVGLMLYVELFLLPKTAVGKRLFLDRSIAERSQPPPARAEDVVGQTGEALTTLAPTGMVLVAGRKYEAASQSGLLPKGAPVKVVRVETFRLIVTKS